MKLFDQTKEPKPSLGDVVRITTEDDSLEPESQSIDIQVAEFNKHVTAFNSLNVIDEQIAKENFNFIDKGNYVLYNEYIKSVTSNLNMGYIPVLAQETVNTLPTTALNHHIALEGFIGDMWAKIKEIFAKIYNSIKEFFKKYFTRLGRVKNKINNLIEVLGETNKDIKQTRLDKVPGSLASKYPITGEIDVQVISEAFLSVSTIIDSFGEINKKAEAFANKDVLDKDFVANIVKLKDTINTNNDKMVENNANKKSYTKFNGTSLKGTYDHNKPLNAENKSLEKEAKDSANKIADGKETISNITSKETDLDMDDKKGEEAQREFASFVRSLADVLNKVKGKPLVKGKVITEVKVDETTGIEIETDENKESPNGVVLEDKATLIKLLKSVLAGIENAEKLSTIYGKINDKIMENLNKVDKLINDINKIPEENFGKYKKLLNNKVKVRLNLAKTFFNNYNKICKNVLEMTMDCADGVVDYSVLSLKNFG